MSENIVFTHETALEILRYASLAGVRLEPTSMVHAPKRYPSKQELSMAIGRIERTLPLLGLSRPAHFAIRGESHPRVSEESIVHTCNIVLPRGSLLRYDERLLVASAPLALAQVAFRKDVVATALKAFEMCGLYRVLPDGGIESGIPPLTNVLRLRSYYSMHSSLPGAQKALNALKYVCDRSASPRESQLLLNLCLPTRMGGYGIRLPAMDWEVACDEQAAAISGRASLRCDLCWPGSKLDVEYQSREYHSGEDRRIRDSRRANALKSMGFDVIDVTNREFDTVADVDAIARAIRLKLGERDRVRTKDYCAKKMALRKRLGLRCGLG